MRENPAISNRGSWKMIRCDGIQEKREPENIWEVWMSIYFAQRGRNAAGYFSGDLTLDTTGRGVSERAARRKRMGLPGYGFSMFPDREGLVLIAWCADLIATRLKDPSRRQLISCKPA